MKHQLGKQKIFLHSWNVCTLGRLTLHSIVDPFPYAIKHPDFDPIERLHKSISIIKAEADSIASASERTREFSHYLLSDFLIPKERSPPLEKSRAPSSRRGAAAADARAGLYNKRIDGGEGAPRLKHTHTTVSRNTGTRRPCYARSAAARRHYSGLNNIMSRGKRDLCNWTRERARSVGSIEETSLPPSVPPWILSPTAVVSRHVTAYMSCDDGYKESCWIFHRLGFLNLYFSCQYRFQCK